MLHSILDLLSQTWTRLVAALGTTTLSILIFSFIAPAVAFVLNLIPNARVARKAGQPVGSVLKKSILNWSTGIAAGVPLAVWAVLIAAFLLITIYKDHQDLLGRIRTLREESDTARNTAQSDSKRYQERIEHLENQLRSGTRTLVDEPKKCWLYDYWTEPKPNVTGSTISTVAVMYCNKRTDVPVVVGVEFDGEFIEGTSFIPGVGVMSVGGGQERNSKVFVNQIDSPPVLAYQPVVVQVQGRRMLHALRGILKTKE